ncbi:hypothetical protein BgAZ_100310 [Babesia gibsoni]|uniref:Golgi apparatus membrane protein TVP23 homolog n=1 Tax=Babesia gibsoni TaxID=33632 RepID=A0AAD8PF49_BABGI|nr:hypothetical protein BgAZ_100310 [Babesia gibsoni]
MGDLLSGAINGGLSSVNSSDIHANVMGKIQHLPHPVACIAHVAFKAAIVIAYFIFPYILGAIVGSYPDYILTFEIIALLALADYWIVKNLTASSLAGIAWYCDTSVSNEFIYKTVKDAMFLNEEETQLFWTVLYVWPTPWALNILFRLTTIDLPSLILSFLIFFMAMLNLVNCMKCSQDKRTKTSQFTGEMAGKFMSFVKFAKSGETIFPN